MISKKIEYLREHSWPVLTSEMVVAAETSTGYKLPADFIEFLRFKNGAWVRPEPVVLPLADSGVAVSALMGVGDFELGIDSQLGSDYQVREWGYPDIGVVFAQTNAGGHDAFMFDYEGVFGSCHPKVSYVRSESEPRVISSSFGEFISLLELDSLPTLAVLEVSELLENAMTGDPEAELRYGWRLMQEETSGNFSEALSWIERAAVRNHPPAMVALARHYGIPRNFGDSPLDPEVGAHWLDRAVQLGDPSAMELKAVLLAELGNNAEADALERAARKIRHDEGE